MDTHGPSQENKPLLMTEGLPVCDVPELESRQLAGDDRTEKNVHVWLNILEQENGVKYVETYLPLGSNHPLFPQTAEETWQPLT